MTQKIGSGNRDHRHYKYISRLVWIAFLGGGLFLSANSARATLLAGWNFNDSDLIVDHGAGTLVTSGLTTAVFLPIGSTLNLAGSDTAGNSLSYVTTSSNNGGSLTLQVSTAGFSAPILTYSVGSIATSFNAIQWSYSIDNNTYSNIGTSLTIPTISSLSNLSLMQVQTVDYTSIGGTLNQPILYLRATFGGNSSIVGASLLLDNIQINATAIPEPATYGALGGFMMLCVAVYFKYRRKTFSV